MIEKPTSSSVKAALRLKYQSPEFACLEEVRNATGRLKKRRHPLKADTAHHHDVIQPRYADMLVMGLWPSSGLEVMGFEVKVSRADWLAEIGDEKKAVAVQQFCDRWYLVTPNEKIVKPEELPEGWGWLVAEGGRVREVVPAPKLSAKPVTREFLASLMRNATTSNPDYLDVQAEIIMRRMATAPAPRSKSAIKTVRRQSMMTLAAEVKRLKRVIADMQLASRATHDGVTAEPKVFKVKASALKRQIKSLTAVA